MEKDNYVRAFPTEQRCVGGTFLQAGVMIDESSGSTGTITTKAARKSSHNSVPPEMKST